MLYQYEFTVSIPTSYHITNLLSIEWYINTNSPYPYVLCGRVLYRIFSSLFTRCYDLVRVRVSVLLLPPPSTVSIIRLFIASYRIFYSLSLFMCRSCLCSCSSPFDCIYRSVSLSRRIGSFSLSLRVVSITLFIMLYRIFSSLSLHVIPVLFVFFVRRRSCSCSCSCSSSTFNRIYLSVP